jgi:hypothetical protein
MKKILLLTILLTGTVLSAQERVYVATDRTAYIAGDIVYCSLFCLDKDGNPGGNNAVSYLELISSEGTAAEAKIGLMEGRGAGSFRIPVTVPTGNYRLVAYTADAVPEVLEARIISVYNTGSTARVKGGVTIVPQGAYKAPKEAPDVESEEISISLPSRLQSQKEASLLISAKEADADLSVSVFHDDGLSPENTLSLREFLSGGPARPSGKPAEYEGEVILARVDGFGSGKEADVATAFLSSAGAPSNAYIGRSWDDGLVRFYTANIYGDREIVCEVSSISGTPCRLDILSPFVHPEAGSIPQLALSPAQRGALVARKASLRDNYALPLDTLVQFLPKREDLLFAGYPSVRYHLDDYNRFPSIREICTEFIRELQFVRRDGRWRVRMMVNDGTSSRKYLQDNILVMMDGVILTDHGMLESFDAGLIEDVDIYAQAIAIGGVSYNGAVNIVTKKNYVTALRFPENVRVVDFRGVSYPVAYPGEAPSENDTRQLLYWHPAMKIRAGGQEQIRLRMPSYPGVFRVVVEGRTAKGKPVRAEYSFRVD